MFYVLYWLYAHIYKHIVINIETYNWLSLKVAKRGVILD